jgi:TRAP-type transport system periplasmic protein
MMLALGGSAASASPRLISVVSNAATESPQKVGADAFRSEATSRLGGQVYVEARNSEALGSENALVAAVRAGSADIAVLSGPAVGPVVPEFGVYDVPFLFRDAAHVRAVANGPIGGAIAAKFPAKGLVLLAVGEQGFRHITNSQRPIRTPADLKGLKIRVLPNEVYKTTFRTLGAEPVPMEFPLVYTALKENRIDGQENPAVTIDGSRFQDVQKHVSKTGHFYAPVAIVMNRETYEAFAPEERKALVEAAVAAADATRSFGARSAADAFKHLTDGGMQLVENVGRQAFVDALKAAEPEFEKRFGKDTLAAIRATR